MTCTTESCRGRSGAPRSPVERRGAICEEVISLRSVRAERPFSGAGWPYRPIERGGLVSALLRRSQCIEGPARELPTHQPHQHFSRDGLQDIKGVPLRAKDVTAMIAMSDVARTLRVSRPSSLPGRAGHFLDRAGVAVTRLRQVDVPAAHAAERELPASGVAGRHRAPVVLRPHRDRLLAHVAHSELCRHS
jgi:hypothetical protein